MREQLSEAKNPSQVYYSLLEKSWVEELSGKHAEKAEHGDFISKKQLCSLKSDHLKKSKLDQDPFLEIIKFKKLQELKIIREICHTPLRSIQVHQDAFKCIKQEIKWQITNHFLLQRGCNSDGL